MVPHIPHSFPTKCREGLMESGCSSYCSAPALLLGGRFFNCPKSPGRTAGAAHSLTGVLHRELPLRTAEPLKVTVMRDRVWVWVALWYPSITFLRTIVVDPAYNLLITKGKRIISQWRSLTSYLNQVVKVSIGSNEADGNCMSPDRMNTLLLL